MAIDHDVPWYGVTDAKIRAITADPTGGTTTYGSYIDVPGIKSVAISGDVNSNELRGDNQRLAQMSSLGGLNLSFEFAKSALDLFQALIGGTVVDAGTGTAETATWTLLGDDEMFPYFEFHAKSDGAGVIGGDGHITLHKVVLSSFPELGFAEEDYKTYTVEGAAMRLDGSSKKLITVAENETAAVIA